MAVVDKNVAAVIRKHSERAARGLQKYGVTTEREDLTAEEWLVHLQEELMDAAIYIERRLGDIRSMKCKTCGKDPHRHFCYSGAGNPGDRFSVSKPEER